jgi:ribonuclease HI
VNAGSTTRKPGGAGRQPSTPPAPPKHGVADLAEFQARLDQLRRDDAPPGPEPGGYLAYTDGACLGNPDGPGGWGAYVIGPDETTWQLWGHLSSTSNNRAEVLALLAAIEWVPACSSLLVRSDSEYTLKVLSGAYKAKANRDLWDAVRATVDTQRLRLTTEWVRGHAGDPGNEQADRLAVLGAVRGDESRLRAIRGASAPSAPRRAPSAPKALPDELAGLEPRGAWESSFVASVAKQVRAGRELSEKQRAVIDRIRARSTS